MHTPTVLPSASTPRSVPDHCKKIDPEMEKVNLLCETKDCSNPAKIFGLSGPKKIRSCEVHFPELMNKATKFFDISGYNFISNLHDAVVFDERKQLKEKGLGNLTVLEATCESYKNAAILAIERVQKSVVKAVDDRFEEMKLAVTQTCTEVKRQLDLLRSELEQFLEAKERQLSPTAERVCSDVSEFPAILRFSVAEAADRVSAALSGSWAVGPADVQSALKCLDAAQRSAAAQAALEEAAEFAERGLPDSLSFADLVTGDDENFDERKLEVMKVALDAEKRINELNAKWMQRSWDLRQRCGIINQATVEVGQHLANILYRQYGRFTEAEEMLRNCYEMLQPEDQLSETSMSVCNDICGLYFAAARYPQVQQLGAWVLETYRTADLPAEQYWTALFYLIYSMNVQLQVKEANQVLSPWSARDFQGETNLARMMRLLTCGVQLFFDMHFNDAVKLLLQARRLGTCHFPTSPFAAVASFHLARAKKREQCYREAQSVYEAVAPRSIQAAVNLSSLGDFLRRQKRWDEAEKCLKQAKTILESVAPKSVQIGDNMLHTGYLFEEKEEVAQALECFEQAAAIYAESRDTLRETDATEAVARVRNRQA